ncbi:MAG: phosphoglycerate kinase [Alphaproteobacteria bacterium]
MGNFVSLADIDVKGKRVLVRADLNVPVHLGAVSDDARIRKLLPTIKALTARGAKVILLSHFGRPKGRDVTQSLRIILPVLEKLLGQKVEFAEDSIGKDTEQLVAGLSEGDVALLENLRFYPQEEANDKDFAAALALLGDVYVNDAFSAAHRAHASIEALARLLPAAAGLLMQAELEALSKSLEQPVRPVAALVGGAKISTKLDVLNNLVEKCDYLILGGGMANTFLLASGIAVGKSLKEAEMLESARNIIAKAKNAGCELVLPVDVVVSTSFSADAEYQTVDVGNIPDDKMALDVGEKSVARINQVLQQCKTLVWNGPLGAFELAPFAKGTVEVARCAADLTAKGQLLSVAGGGDTMSALATAGVEEKFSYISSAGGAFLEWLEGKILPGVAVLPRKQAA